MTHFYLTLRSDLSVEAPRVEALAKFTTVLPQRVELDGDWEVGLAEISYPSLSHNIYSRFHYLLIGQRRPTRLGLRNTLCESIEDVLHELTRVFNNWRRSKRSGPVSFTIVNTRADAQRMVGQGNIGFFYVKNIRKVGFYFTWNMKLSFSTDLAKVLGFSPNVAYFTLAAGLVLGEHEATISSNRPFRTAYVYTDIMEPVIVGNVKVRLLRIVETNGADVVHAIFTSPIYVPLQTKNFDTVEVNITSDTGQPLPFLQGKSMVVLHFRKIAS
jgi:hypothetical protein